MLMILGACREETAPPPTRAADVYRASEPRVVDETEDTRALLLAELKRQGIDASAIVVSESAGPLQTTRLWASVDGDAKPRVTALMADLRHYGPLGRGLAELAAARQWLTRPPAASELAELVRFTWLPTLTLDADHAPVLAAKKHRLVLTFEADDKHVSVDIPAEGEATITVDDHIEEGGPAELATLRAALRDADTRALKAALSQPIARSPERDALLTRVAAQPDPDVADAAIVMLGSGEDAVQAFAEAWPALDRDARERIRRRVESVHGEGFVTRLP